MEQIEADPVSKMLQVTCARCHKLSFEGRVSSSTAEQELPEFDLAATVGAKIARRTARRAVVAVVVDIADFDGSLPRCGPPWRPWCSLASYNFPKNLTLIPVPDCTCISVRDMLVATEICCMFVVVCSQCETRFLK